MDASILTIGIIISYGMGWQKRATGNIYGLLTGHCFHIGCLIQKVANYGVMNKRCQKCITNEKLQTDYKYEWNTNRNGNSGVMEVALALKMTQRTFDNSDGLVHIGTLVSDDDTIMRSYLHN